MTTTMGSLYLSISSRVKKPKMINKNVYHCLLTVYF